MSQLTVLILAPFSMWEPSVRSASAPSQGPSQAVSQAGVAGGDGKAATWLSRRPRIATMRVHRQIGVVSRPQDTDRMPQTFRLARFVAAASIAVSLPCPAGAQS